MTEQEDFTKIRGYRIFTRDNAYFRLGESDYIDHTGTERIQPAPEGFVRADDFVWHSDKEFLTGWLEEIVAGMEEGDHYHVLIKKAPK